jgi:hypothetical protein
MDMHLHSTAWNQQGISAMPGRSNARSESSGALNPRFLTPSISLILGVLLFFFSYFLIFFKGGVEMGDEGV